MRRAGSESWLLSIATDGSPHRALYVREALRLRPVDDLAPPRALRAVPDRSELLTEQERDRAATQWASWWRASLRVGEPPDFDALTGAPELRRAVVALQVAARRWAAAVSAPVERPGIVRWELMRDVAEEVARSHGVSPGDVRGVVQVLAVEGVWWRLVGPGSVVCSTAAVQDEDVAAKVLRQVCASGLA